MFLQFPKNILKCEINKHGALKLCKHDPNHVGVVGLTICTRNFLRPLELIINHQAEIHHILLTSSHLLCSNASSACKLWHGDQEHEEYDRKCLWP